MGIKIAACVLVALLVYHTNALLGNKTFVKMTSQCAATGISWNAHALSPIMCVSLCVEEVACKSVLFTHEEGHCHFCTVYGILGQQLYPGAVFFRPTQGVRCNRYLLDDIPDSHFTASSQWDERNSPDRARLSSRGSDSPRVMGGGWSSADWDNNKYIQARFYATKEVTKCVTMGRHYHNVQFVKSYKFSYSNDCVSFAFVTDPSNETKIFEGNVDRDNSVIQELPQPLLALCVRVHPVTWHEHPTLRFDIVGCDW